MDDLLARAGTLRAAYEAVDWAASPVGPVEQWSPALRNTVDLMLGTDFAITLLWGPEFTLIYNEAYVELIADKHPAALGAPAREIFPEAWHVVGPMMEGVLATGEAASVRDALVPLDRSGYLEECYFTYSYSPVGPTRAPEGVIDVAIETTPQVLAARRLAVLADLDAALGSVEDLETLRERAAHVLRSADVPTADLWLPGTGRPRPVGVPEEDPTGVTPTHDGDAAWLVLPVIHGALRGSVLRAGLNRERRLDEDYRDFLRLVAASLARAADRVATLRAERSVSSALQVSVLEAPASLPGLDVAVRYRPAADVVQIGGDWYDSFCMPDGSLAVVVGDVAGHDVDAAATMAQLRNLTRGIAQVLPGSPAGVLAGVDSAVRTLDVAAVATVVLVSVSTDGRSARWSSAGHLPPVLIDPTGAARVLEAPPDLLLGLDPGLPRADHEVELAAGSVLVLYSDGLVERRGTAIDESLAWLTGVLDGQVGLDHEQLADRVLAAAGDDLEDDVALLVLRVG